MNPAGKSPAEELREDAPYESEGRNDTPPGEIISLKLTHEEPELPAAARNPKAIPSAHPALAEALPEGQKSNVRGEGTPTEAPAMLPPESQKPGGHDVGFGYSSLLIFLLGILLLALSLVMNRQARQANRQRRKTLPPERTFLILNLCNHMGESRIVRSVKSPLKVGNREGCDLYLRTSGLVKKTVFAYSWNRDGAKFVSSREFFMNGVALKDKVLQVGDRLRFGSYKLSYNGLETEAVPFVPVRNYSFTPLSAGSFLLILSILLGSIQKAHIASGSEMKPELKQPLISVSESPSGKGVSPMESIVLAKVASEVEGNHTGGKVVVAKTDQALSTREAGLSSPGRHRAAGEMAVSLGSSHRTKEEDPAVHRIEKGYQKLQRPEKPRVKPLVRYSVGMVAPGEQIEYFKADMLFIHAHPDDESLDFAGLMAKAVRHGKRVVTVVFTDGESGYDQFPNRGIDGSHPARDLHREELARVRVEEARSALSFLGSELYVRLGLRNHPYNTVKDVMPVSDVIGNWGGEQWLLSRMREVLEGFKPEIVVSSDFNAVAYEHFEHKTVGRLIYSALRSLREEGKDFVKGYLVSVDPFQARNLYIEMEKIDMMEKDSYSGLSLREIQCAALKEHRTQGDASCIGLELLPNFRWERYSKVYWELGVTPEAYVHGSD